jgi:hypothetical protein
MEMKAIYGAYPEFIIKIFSQYSVISNIAVIRISLWRIDHDINSLKDQLQRNNFRIFKETHYF